VAEEIVGRQLRVRGHVQGVFFRSATRREAERRGVSGWAANLPDGSVEIVLEGRSADLEEVVSYCERGPRGAEVTDLEAREHRPLGLSGFEIR
jgi:acylphosphatase